MPFLQLALLLAMVNIAQSGVATAMEVKNAGADYGHRSPSTEFWIEPPDGHHKLYVEVYAPKGVDFAEFLADESSKASYMEHPLLYFHGGWGPLLADMDIIPSDFFTVYFHQRGWGKSLPTGSIENNSLELIVEDAELIREEIVDKRKWVSSETKWSIHGGSNGATLAMMYLAKYYEFVKGAVLRGYWSMERKEIEWDYLGKLGKKTIFPEEWKRVYEKGVENLNTLEGRALQGGVENTNALSVLQNQNLQDSFSADNDIVADVPPNLLDLYQMLLATPDTDREIGCNWLRYDALGSEINAVPRDVCIYQNQPEWYQIHPVAAARIGVHIYRQTHKVPDFSGMLKYDKRHILVHFVSGRFDMLCPPVFTADLVEKANSSSWKQTIVEHAAHSASDPGMGIQLEKALRERLLSEIV